MGESTGLGAGAVIAIAAAAFILGGLGGCVFGVVTSPSGNNSTTGSTVTVTRFAQTQAPQSSAAAPRPTGPQTTIASDGTYVVGTDILPGVYRTAGPVSTGRNCYYKRLASFDSSDIIDNEGAKGPQVVEILASDAAFSTSNCQPWQRVS
ncbi:hypothetical protein JDV09_03230 [Mycobacterium sp. Y57]|uniref:hypothetical protein n=1 Tax=Mycolicibacterium xanthum TaxID=2796469 RepID=UPI001C8581FF|nr:hypothetical protein [Mycolicibacterium xanthum]MBX7431127.1 hypothetical protein [Mycolicibacterium xanthum]